MKKPPIPTEIAYIVGLMLLSLGTCLMTKADFGISMIAAPAYLTHLLLSQNVSHFFTFGRCEIILEVIVVLSMCIIIKKFRVGYLFSVMAGVIYGTFLDVWILIFRNYEVYTFINRLIPFLLGQVVTAFGIALLFKSYFPPAAYDFFVKEMSSHFKIDVPKFKTAFDISFVIISIVLSFIIFGFGHFEGIKLGTVFIAIINGTTIGMATKIINKLFNFYDLFGIRKAFK